MRTASAEGSSRGARCRSPTSRSSRTRRLRADPRTLARVPGIYQQFGPTNGHHGNERAPGPERQWRLRWDCEQPDRLASRDARRAAPSDDMRRTDPAFNFLVADAVVGPLTDNGGLTRTHALLAGSPAIDRGQNCSSDDQRGVSRGLRAAPATSAPTSTSRREQPSQPPPPPPDDELPEPEAGKTVNVLPKGTVKVKLPGRNRFRTLAEGEQLPVGTVVDTSQGTRDAGCGRRTDRGLLRRHLPDHPGQGRQAADAR